MFGLIDGQVLERFARYQGIRAGTEVETPKGPGKIAGKHMIGGLMRVLVDHGERAAGMPVVVAYPIDDVRETSLPASPLGGERSGSEEVQGV